VGKTRRPSREPTQENLLWAYAYQMLPPSKARRTDGVRALLEEENLEAKRNQRTWTAKLIQEQQVTHVLIVSDSPEQDGEANRRLEAKLKELNVPFARTVPLPVVEETEPDKEQE
jgi:hypothetical protein